MLFFPSSDLCLQTQPVPSPLSYYMHQSPKALHKGEVLTNHFVELLAPWLLLLPLRGLRLAGGVIQLVFQVGQSHKLFSPYSCIIIDSPREIHATCIVWPT